METIITGAPVGSFPNMSIAWDDHLNVQIYLSKLRGEKLSFNVTVVSKMSEKMKLYRYLHKAVLPVLLEELVRDGWENMDLVAADSVLKNLIARQPVYNSKTKEEGYILIDKKDMNKGRLLKYVVDAIHFLESQYGRVVMSGDEYKEMLRIQKEKEENGKI